MRLGSAASLLLLPAVLADCYLPRPQVTLRVELPSELLSRANDLKVLPAIAEIRRSSAGGVLLLELKKDAGHVRLTLPGACSERVELGSWGASAPAALVLKPLFDVGTSERVVGLGQAFEVRARPNCPEAESARSTFTITGGAPLDDVVVAPNGRRFSAATCATPPRTEPASGIVAVSARVQQRLRSELAFRVELADGGRFERPLGVAAVARSSGLADVGLSHPVLWQAKVGACSKSLRPRRPRCAGWASCSSFGRTLPDATGSATRQVRRSRCTAAATIRRRSTAVARVATPKSPKAQLPAP